MFSEIRRYEMWWNTIGIDPFGLLRKKRVELRDKPKPEAK